MTFCATKPRGGGRQRESFQLGIENIGGERIACDAEVIQVAMEALQRVGIARFQFNLGEMGFFAGLVERVGLSARDLSRIRKLIDLKDPVGLQAEMERLQLPPRQRKVLHALLHLTGNAETIDAARRLVSNEKSLSALDNLAGLYAELKRRKLTEHLTIDLSEVRGLDYYTGIIFKIYVPGLGFEVGSGGRYDNLLKNFGCDFPSVGFTFFLERLMALPLRLK